MIATHLDSEASTAEAIDSLDALRLQVSNVTHVVGAWFAAVAAAVEDSVLIPILETPEGVLGGAVVAIASVLCFACMIVRGVSAVVARRRRRHNALIVEIADYAPEDDCEEHELEKHTTARTAAPGDSDHEDDMLSGPGRVVRKK